MEVKNLEVGKMYTYDKTADLDQLYMRGRRLNIRSADLQWYFRHNLNDQNIVGFKVITPPRPLRLSTGLEGPPFVEIHVVFNDGSVLKEAIIQGRPRAPNPLDRVDRAFPLKLWYLPGIEPMNKKEDIHSELRTRMRTPLFQHELGARVYDPSRRSIAAIKASTQGAKRTRKKKTKRTAYSTPRRT